MHISAAREENLKQVRQIAGEVFSEFGNYASLLPRFFESRGVSTFLAWEGQQALGFIMLGFLPWSAGSEEQVWIADILALAVRREHQRQGVGRKLLGRAEQLIKEMKEWREVRRIELTCAAENHTALEFFRKHGFEVVDPHHGNYVTGQAAVRMAKKL
jgi:ribosomal protein S18 acetylase RimI-like enzyme